MAETSTQSNNIATKFKKQKGLDLKKAHRRGLVSDKQLAKLQQKEKRK